MAQHKICFYKIVLQFSNLYFIDKNASKRLCSKHSLNIFVLPWIPRIFMVKIFQNLNEKVLYKTQTWKRTIYNWILLRWAYQIFELTEVGVYKYSIKFLSSIS